MADGTFLRESLGGFLDRVASREAAPGGGSVAAVAVALAAGLCAMAARFSGEEFQSLVDRAEALRARVAPLAEADAEAYGAVLGAQALSPEPDPAARQRRISAALSAAADVPLAVAAAGAEVAELAADLAQRGNRNLRGDAVTACLLAQAGARAAAVLVDINVGAGGDGRATRARGYADAAERQADKLEAMDD
jgi:formiminotetrahydrofolate cyclodeaminase